MKVIFLDVDGVLNSDFPTRHQLASGEWIDRERVRLLGEIVRRTGAREEEKSAFFPVFCTVYTNFAF